MEVVFEHIAETDIGSVVNYLLDLKPLPDIITLEGDLGAGKTTLVKALLQALGSDDGVSSPTFSLLNEYRLKDGSALYHSDWYRIENPAELFDAGIAEHIDSGDRMIIEWPGIGMEYLYGLPLVQIKIKHTSPGRTYRIKTIQA